MHLECNDRPNAELVLRQAQALGMAWAV